MYEDMDLDDLIKLYASSIHDPGLDVMRIQLHAALCDKLGVDTDDFKPFDDEDLEKFLTDEQAERHLRQKIAELKAGQSASQAGAGLTTVQES